MNINSYKEVSDNIKNINSIERFIEEHKKLLNESDDLAFKYVRDFLLNATDNDYKFSIDPTTIINSNYLSSYFKRSILELVNDEEIVKMLNQEKDFNDMTEDEIKKIYDLYIEECRNNSSNLRSNIFSYFELYLFQLNGNEVNNFIKNNLDNSRIGNYVLKLSGLPNNTLYFEKEVVDCRYLGSDNLKKIFDKLYLIDSEYALEFSELVCRIDILGMVEFIDLFKQFVNNGFKIDGIYINDLYDNDDKSVIGKVFTSYVRDYEHEDNITHQINLSTTMKQNFLYKVRDKLLKLNPDILVPELNSKYDKYRRY